MSSSAEARDRWRWLWNRLRCMGPAEIPHRGARMLRSHLGRRFGFDRPTAPPPDPDRAGACWLRVPVVDALAEGETPYRVEAEAIGAGSLRLFERERFRVGRRPDWLRCPLTGVRAPDGPSHRIAITERAQVGDIKYLWELNRLVHWVSLAQAWALRPADEAPLRLLGEQLRDWLGQNPMGTGPNWISPLELAIRLLNWSAVWQLIGGHRSPLFAGPTGEALRRDWLASIWQHAWATRHGYSRHSSANNHLVGELCGLYVAARTWPCWPELDRAGGRARHELIEQARLQIHPDGVPAEQAFGYAGLIHDFFLVAACCAQAAGEAMPEAYHQRLRALGGFTAAMLDRSNHAPMVGDADGAEALRLDPRPGGAPLPGLLEKQAALQGSPLPSRGGPRARRDDVLWLGLEPAPVADTEPPMCWSFEAGGYQLFGERRGEPGEVLGGVDVGPLGYLGIAAHGHADALQLWMSLDGRPLLVDPGTYAYWDDRAWRDYFRGTSAHNTLQVDERDQSESGGRFMWVRHAQCKVLAVQRDGAGGLHLRASHDGYAPLRVEREVDFRPGRGALTVTDRCEHAGEHGLALHWHLAPGWDHEWRSDDGLLTLRQGGWTVRLRVEATVPGELELIAGQGLPRPLGWTSAVYGDKQPSPVLRWRGQGSRVQWRTTVEWSRQA